MIRHAPEAALCPVDPLPVPVIEPSFRAVLVFPVGKPHLVASHPAAAPLSAVDLPPVAGTADVEHGLAPRPPARHLDPQHLSDRRIPARFHGRMGTVECGRERSGLRPGIRGREGMGGTDGVEA